MSEPTTTSTTEPLETEIIALMEPVPPCELYTLWHAMAETAPPDGQKALVYCAEHLGVWIKHEGAHVMMCMPPPMRDLILFAMQFNQREKDDWRKLAGLAVACQGDTQ